MTQIAFKLFTLAAVARQLPLTHQPSNWPITLLTCDRNAISPIVALLLPLFFIMFFCKNRNAIKINKSGLLWTKTAKTQKKRKKREKNKNSCHNSHLRTFRAARMLLTIVGICRVANMTLLLPPPYNTPHIGIVLLPQPLLFQACRF